MSEKENIFNEINRNLSQGKPFVAATIIQTAGSSPRRTGARMLVYPDGSIFGTIGGGNFEKLVIDDCLRLFHEKKETDLKKYSFSREGDDATGMCCGGEAKVFMEKFGEPKRLVIFGGGHVGRDIVKVCRGLDFSITVIDDRREILDSYDPGIERIHTDKEYRDNIPALDQNCYVVIVTRSHDCDRIILEKVMKYECAYVGMIGSQKKVSRVFHAMREKGISEEKLSAVRAPVGLDIGGEGPYEIAVSIAAELIAAARGTLGNF
jgi:xanthine dehydrogenase accessory factor